MDTVIKAFGLVFEFDVMIAIVASAFYGLTVGALPGLSATMAMALLVPVTADSERHGSPAANRRSPLIKDRLG